MVDLKEFEQKAADLRKVLLPVLWDLQFRKV